ncbi:hypothetical protein DERP_007906 [Dermatophagoides pteronyssinus]|uniref:Chitin-binding type-2 domain-containing protein n=1 Tax=Dermatophagoides pteronyssinus TaxID=6956 RepID=A0ABQ8ITN3_DERPT|nr:hypothetical protein DERP_007906 [Dermatophagoides pteronyssinus]
MINLNFFFFLSNLEPISLNSIEQANAAFRCQSDGYFADVAYGCQFYHVCENANNPFDKPHTFSCVNGTVFNQMSFTCTRLDDSIPCEKSPTYFYLNKPYRTSSKSPEPTSKYSQILKNYTPLSSNIETSTNRPLLLDIIDQPQQPQPPIGTRKTHLPFTPATFSQIYIENQKQSKLESSIPSTYLRLVEQRQQKQQQQQRKPTLKAFNHVNEQLISLTPPPSSLNKSIDHYSTTGSSNHHGSILSPTSSPTPLTKYEQLIAQSLAKNHQNHNGRRSKSTKQIAPNHYVTIESPINILDTTQQEISRSSSLNGKDSSTGRTILDDDDDQQQQQPVKISFVTDNNNNNNNQGNLKNHRLLSSTTIANNNNDNNEQNQQSTSFVDYGTTNYKVVKQIKGKNLLIDPSLENDPERDNIIAQVLEMLSKYN